MTEGSLLVLAILALLSFYCVEKYRVIKKQPYYEEKVEAARLQAEAMKAIRLQVLRVQRSIDPAVDPADSGLIGRALTSLTSVVGYLSAKQTSVNPNFAAVAVHLMKQLGLEKGDFVAISASGSFPAINLAVLVACKVLDLRCVMISSVAASMYGANHPRMTWLDMERIAYEQGFIDTRSVAASIGGIDDNGAQLPEAGVEYALKAIERNRVRLIKEGSLQANIEARLKLYEEVSAGKPYKAFINIGGGEASVGSRFTKVLFKPGINRTLPRKKIPAEGVMTLMMQKYGIPAINFSSVNSLAEKYGLPVAPQKMPEPGQGPLFYDVVYNVPLAAGLLAALIVATVIVLRFDVGRVFGFIPRPRGQESRE